MFSLSRQALNVKLINILFLFKNLRLSDRFDPILTGFYWFDLSNKGLCVIK